MAKRRGDSIGSHPVATFQTTCWKDLQTVKTADQGRQRMAVSALTERYWKPVYWFLRRKGYGHEQAEDLTQGFFHEIVLGHSLFELADQSKGRFRTFLLSALVRYVSNEHRKEESLKRSPVGELRSLDACPSWEDISAAMSPNPERAFLHAWAADLLDQAMTEVKQEFCSSGREVYWQTFHARVIAPITEEAKEPSLGEICRTYGIETKKNASNMIVTVKRRFQSVLRRILGETLACESEVEGEIGELISILSEDGAA